MLVGSQRKLQSFTRGEPPPWIFNATQQKALNASGIIKIGGTMKRDIQVCWIQSGSQNNRQSFLIAEGHPAVIGLLIHTQNVVYRVLTYWKSETGVYHAEVEHFWTRPLG